MTCFSKVALSQATFVSGWMTVRRYTALIFNQVTQANSARPSLVGKRSE